MLFSFDKQVIILLISAANPARFALDFMGQSSHFLLLFTGLPSQYQA